MRVVLGFPMEDEQTGVYIKNVFIENGCEVVGIHDPKREAPDVMLRLAERLKPDLIFMSRSIPYVHVIAWLKKISICTFWNVDVRYNIREWSALYPLMEGCHFWFTIAKGNIPEYKAAGLGTPYWLSEGCDRIHRLRPGGKTNEHDVFFAGSIGNVHEDRKRIVSTVKTIFKNSNIVNGLYLVNEDHNDAVGMAKVCLGHSGWPGVELSMSARDYRVMGAGGFLLTNHVEGIENWFDLDKECVTYSSPTDCIEKIRYYLAHDKEREKIAAAGYNAAHKKHRFKNRIAEVLDIAGRG